jgi:hypothetical protein
MTRIKPSQGASQRPGDRVLVEGKFAGPIIESNNFGGRWTIEVRDHDDLGIGNTPAVLSANWQPQDNPHLPKGIHHLRSGVKSLFKSPEFAPLFREGAPFLAEALVGFVDGRPWLNVSEWLLIEPEFPVGVRQILGEPICDRRIMLAARGVKSSRRSNAEDGGGGFIVGDLVHSVFQAIATAPAQDRARLITKALQAPQEIVADFFPREVALKFALLEIGNSPEEINFSPITTSSRHISNLVSSQLVNELLGNEQWHSEVRVAHPAIDGVIDIRSANTILELKTVSIQKKAHIEQAQLYLVADMLKHGVHKVYEGHKAFVVLSSSQITDDSLRVTPVHQDRTMLLQLLDRFITARHRYLLVGGRVVLPEINMAETECEDCPYFKDDPVTGKPSACHFYCQTDRSWTCDNCRHQHSCTQSQTRHSYEALDDANRIRSAVLEEIQSLRREEVGKGICQDYEKIFEIAQIHSGGQLTLSPMFTDDIDPPRAGSDVFIQPHGWNERIQAEIIRNGFAEDNWIIATSARMPSLATGMQCRVFQSRSRVSAVYALLTCVDELQRQAKGSSVEGISFAGGRTLSGKLRAVDSIEKAIDAGAEDIFCQCFNLNESRSILKQCLEINNMGRTLIVTDAPVLGINNDSILKLDAPEIQAAITGVFDAREALKNLKAKLENHRVWVISSRRLMSDCLKFLPANGVGFFDHLVLFEAVSISPLNYFTIRSLGKRRICMGDANTIGVKMTSALAIESGLGNNLLHRVAQKGFPTPETAVMVKQTGQKLPAGVSEALVKCKMETICEPDEKCTLNFKLHDFPSEITSAESYFENHLVENPSLNSREIRVRPEGAPSELQIREDIKGLDLNLALLPQARLLAPVSGNVYIVLTPPTPTPSAPTGKCLVKVERNITHSSSIININEASLVADKVRQITNDGTKLKNIAIISPFADQLSKISEILGSEGKGLTYRTPYNICGEQWGTCIISCCADSLLTCEQDVGDPRFFYTMFRACINNLYLFGHQKFVSNHPFLRSIELKLN